MRGVKSEAAQYKRKLQDFVWVFGRKKEVKLQTELVLGTSYCFEREVLLAKSIRSRIPCEEREREKIVFFGIL